MGFSNPAQPIDYDLIAQLVGDISINSTQVRNACDEALESTDDAIAALQALLESVATAISSLSANLSEVQPRPSVPGWSSTREDALAALVAVQLALDAANARADASPEAAAVVSDLEDQAADLWTTVKP